MRLSKFIIGAIIIAFSINLSSQVRRRQQRQRNVPQPTSTTLTTNVTATITDSDGQTWYNGTWSANLFNPSSTQQPVYTATGQPVQVLIQNQTMDATGKLSYAMPDNNQITPLGTRWNYTLCSNTSAPCVTTTTPLLITGTSMDVSTALSNQTTPPRFNPGNGMHGYNDNEVINYQLGSTYYNLTRPSNRQYNGSTWVDITGGMPPSGNVNEVQINNNGSLGPATGVTYNNNGGLNATAFNGTVNTVYNVMAAPYNAKGDGVTDDASSINAACMDARKYAPSAVVEFPKPPVKYLVSPLVSCTGVSLRGQIQGLSGALPSGGIVIQGKAGLDILHSGDPNDGGANASKTYTIQDIQFVVDDSIDASSSGTNQYPHRWPGRFATDGSIAAGTNALTSTKSLFGCNDIGQQVTVYGAGPSGSNLTSTITNVTGCAGIRWSIATTITATLQDNASTTVSNGLVYTSLAGIAATQTIGNCAMGYDNRDGNNANWTMTQPGFFYARLNNVSFASVSGTPKNNSCAIYYGAVWTTYGIHVDFMNVYRLVYGIVQGMPDTNATSTVGQDLQHWDHLNFQCNYPWISYNGSANVITHVQIGGPNQFQILQLQTPSENSANSWVIHIPKNEQNTGYGLRLEGFDHFVYQTAIASGAIGYWGASGSVCRQCSATSTIQISGMHNNIELLNPVTVVDNAPYYNTVTALYSTVSFNGQPTTNPNGTALNRTRAPYATNHISPAWFVSGGKSQFNNQEDLMFTALDYILTGNHSSVVTDVNSWSGYAFQFTTNATISNFAVFAMTTNSAATIGKNIPAGKVTIYDNARCPSATNYGFQIVAGTTTLINTNFLCTTAYATNSVVVDLTAYSGQSFNIHWLGGFGEVDSCCMAIVPVLTGPNIPMLASLTTTAATSDVVSVPGMTTTGHCNMTPTNASAATNIATTYVGTKAANQVTINHTATAGMNFDVMCTLN